MNSRNGSSRAAGAGRAALVVSALALSAGAVCLGGSAEAASLARLADLYSRESTLQRLQLEYDIAKKAFQDVAERFQV